MASILIRDIPEGALKELKKIAKQHKRSLQQELREILMEGKRLENLKEKALHLNNILHSSVNVAIAATDLDFRIIYYNPVAERFFGYKAEEVIGRTVMEIHTKEKVEPARFEKAIDAVRREGEYRCSVEQKKGDNIRYLENRVTGIWDEKGDLKGFVLFSEDVTEWRRRENELRRLLQAVEQSPATVVITDTEGNIEYVNPRFTLITGYMPEEVMGKSIRLLKSGEQPAEFYRELWETITSGREWRGEFHNRKKGGESYWEQASISPIRDSEGKITHFIKVAEDVTERRMMEEELVKVEKLESLAILAGGIVHDFNNVLTAILGNVSLARMFVNPPTQTLGAGVNPEEERLSRRLEEAEKACLRARDLTQQLLTFSKGGAPVKETASTVDILRESTTFALSGSNVSCKFLIPDNLLPVEVDVGQISQVFQNMIINARQAMPEGGMIEVSAENVTLNRQIQGLPIKDGRYVMVSIKDYGVGIPANHLSRIFDPFFTTKQGGSGLGLAISYSVVKRHGGYITVESKSGVGTTFYIYLPAAKKGIVAADKMEEEPIKGKGRVLVMDDEEMVREVAHEVLLHLGYEADFAQDGAEAVKVYSRAKETGRPFDVVITDLTVPGGVGGKEAIKMLLKIDPEAKVIVSSGYSNDPIMADFKRYGFKGVVVKPYKIRDLSRVMDEVMRR